MPGLGCLTRQIKKLLSWRRGRDPLLSYMPCPPVTVDWTPCVWPLLQFKLSTQHQGPLRASPPAGLSVWTWGSEVCRAAEVLGRPWLGNQVFPIGGVGAGSTGSGKMMSKGSWEHLAPMGFCPIRIYTMDLEFRVERIIQSTPFSNF